MSRPSVCQAGQVYLMDFLSHPLRAEKLICVTRNLASVKATQVVQHEVYPLA